MIKRENALVYAPESLLIKSISFRLIRHCESVLPDNFFSLSTRLIKS